MALLSDVGDGDRGRADSDVPSSAIVRTVEGAGRLLYQQWSLRIPFKKRLRELGSAHDAQVSRNLPTRN